MWVLRTANVSWLCLVAQPAEAAEAEITLGMTTDEVYENLGEPKKKVSFGGKTLWDYDGFQVVFEEGKVIDVKF